jgi:hypothetical protein
MKTNFNDIVLRHLLSYTYHSHLGGHFVKQKKISSSDFQNTDTYCLHKYSDYYNIETCNMPSPGWHVDVMERQCRCSFWNKFGICIHVVYILEIKKTCLLEREQEATEGQADSTKIFLCFKERIEVLIKFHLLSFCLIYSVSHFCFLLKFPKKPFSTKQFFK